MDTENHIFLAFWFEPRSLETASLSPKRRMQEMLSVKNLHGNRSSYVHKIIICLNSTLFKSHFLLKFSSTLCNLHWFRSSATFLNNEKLRRPCFRAQFVRNLSLLSIPLAFSKVTCMCYRYEYSWKRMFVRYLNSDCPKSTEYKDCRDNLSILAALYNFDWYLKSM